MSQHFLPPHNKYTGSFTEDTEGDGVRLNAFNHADVDVAFDPLSANRRFSGTADLAVLGTLVFAGPTRDTISVMVPDCLMPPENATVRVDLRHHVGLSLGPAVDMTNWSPEDHLERALCPGSLADTLGLQRREYWEELNPILKRWKSVNKSSCPDCQKFIQINMGRHIRLKHTTYMCFWRCPVVSCSLWFTAELNAKDHIEAIHKFKEGEGISFYECLRRHGIEWFGSREFFDQRKETNQAIWMDMALARRSGQELRNSYVITNSPEYAPLRRFFKAAVDGLQMVFDRSLVTSVQPKSLLVQMREAIADCDDSSSDGSLMLLSPPHDIPEVTFPAESSMDQETRDDVSPVVIPRRVTPEEITETEVSREGQPIVPSSECEDPLHYEDPVMHISGAGHWFLEGWIGDHSVEFLVDSGSSVTAMSDVFYRNLVQAGAPVGALQITARTLRSANGTGIEVLGCSRCSVSFLGLRTEFPIIVCSLRRERTRSLGQMCWDRCCHIH